jgi:uncharacterized protein (TIRG00374 family)
VLLIWTVKTVVSVGLLYLLLSRVDMARLWEVARTAQPVWLAGALGLYLVMILVSAWRWRVLLDAQHITASFAWLTNSYLVATFFNNFLPSNIGGDVIRIRDTAPQAGSKTLATTIVLLDRGLGLLALVFVAAVGSSLAARSSAAVGPFGPGLLWLGLAALTLVGALVLFRPDGVRIVLAPLERLHQEWVGERLLRLTTALEKFRAAPQALATGLVGGIIVQLVLVAFYAAISSALSIPISLAHLAILVPVSFIVQMLPLSVNGFGVREATFSLYFARLRLPLESALALSFIGAALIMLFSASGAVAYLSRRGQRG